jgi:hypothetical protein
MLPFPGQHIAVEGTFDRHLFIGDFDDVPVFHLVAALTDDVLADRERVWFEDNRVFSHFSFLLSFPILTALEFIDG